MKKNNGRKVALLTALVLIVTLVSTSLLGGTLAKYVTSKAVDETARVAKWGVEVDLTATNLFLDEYTGTANPAVKASGTLVVAPGTSGSMVLEITGTPEVAFEVVFDKGTSAANGWTYKADPSDPVYEPVVWTVNGTDYSGNFAGLLTYLETTLNKSYDANDTVDDDLTIAWSWAFSTNGANDIGDTYYGDQAATATAPNFVVDFTFTATQLN